MCCLHLKTAVARFPSQVWNERERFALPERTFSVLRNVTFSERQNETFRHQRSQWLSVSVM